MSNSYINLEDINWFNVLTTHLPMVFYALDSNGIFFLSEGKGLKKLGFEPGEVVGQSVFELYKDSPEIIDAIHRAFAGETMYFQHRLNDLHFDNYIAPKFDENNNVVALICVAIDISDKMKTEYLLQKEKNWSKAIIDSVPGILYLYDNEERLVYWNKNLEELTGYSPDELFNMKLYDWFKNDDAMIEVIAKELKKAIQGEVACTDTYLRVKSGECIPMHMTAVELEIDGSSYMTGIGIDIREIKKMQQELIETNRNLEDTVSKRTKELTQANQELSESYEKTKEMQSYLIQSEKMAALGNLVAGVAHEINTPIGIGVTAASHLNELSQDLITKVKAGSMDQQDLIEFIEDLEQASGIILRNLNRASKLVKSFKQVSADQASEPRRQFNVKEYLDEILVSLSPKLNKTKHQISVICKPDLFIDGYPGAFAQIISNLLINSLMHAYQPDEVGNIMISITKQEKFIEIIFSDDGKGIDTENIGNIFDPFFTTKRGAGGTGLGLSVVYNIITQQFGGTIYCESQPGKGTSFIIRLMLGGI